MLLLSSQFANLKENQSFDYISNNQNMHGGRLQFGCHAIWQNKLIAAYGSLLYVFSTDSQSCEGSFTIGHQSQIIALSEVENQQFIAIDANGICIKFGFPKQKKPLRHQFFNVIQKCDVLDEKGKKCQNPFSIKIDAKGNIFFLSSADKKLRKYSIQTKTTTTIAHNKSFTRLLSLSESWVLALTDPYQIICVPFVDGKQQKTYKHARQISSAALWSQSLIVGDHKGKIYCLNNFLSKKNNQFYQSKLEWHTGPVLCLQVFGQYLYSAGQESVVVLWHLKDLSRDFLPRVGTAIHSLSVSQITNEILCGMSDNSLKIIDLGNDKLIKQFRVIFDPRGYAPSQLSSFNSLSIHYSPINDEIIFPGLPGRLQAINFRANGQNSEIEIIPRNLINQLDDNALNPNRIKGFCLSKDWSMLLVNIQESFKCCLKFYRRKFGNQFQLVSKVENPHRRHVDGCLPLSGKHSNDIFATFSSSDKTVKIWKQYRQKKKSIIESDQVFWKCEQQISYRQMNPVSVHCLWDKIVVLFSEVLVLYNLNEQKKYEKVSSFSIKKSKLSNIKQIFLLSQSVDQKLNILSVNQSLDGFKILQWDLSTNLLTVYSQFHSKTLINVQTCFSEQSCAIFTHEKGQKTHILVFDRKSLKFTSSHQCPTTIEGGFWRSNQLVFLTKNLNLHSLDKNNFITYDRDNQQTQMEEETVELKEKSQVELDIFNLNQKWVGREAVRNKKKIQNTISSVHLLADCSSALDELAKDMLI